MKNLTKLIIAIALLAGIVAWQGKCFAWSISGTVYEPIRTDGSPSRVLGGAYTYVTVSLTDSAGNEIAKGNTNNSLGKYTFTDLSSGTYTITPLKGDWEFDPPNRTVSVSDADADIERLDFQRVNYPPSILPIEPITLEEGSYFEYYFVYPKTVTDPDGDNVYVFSSPSGLPRGAFLDNTLGYFKWIPDYDQAGTYNISFIASDYYVNGESQPQTMTITVTDNSTPGDLKIISTREQGPAPLYIELAMENIPIEAIPYIIPNYPKATWWDFGDGGMALWPKPKRTLVEPGDYNISLKLVDPNGNALGSTQKTIQVTPEPPPTRKLYLDPYGDDTKDGMSESAAWKTLRHALTQLQAGDTLYLREGTHYITEGSVTIWASGSLDTWITITAYPNEHPILITDGDLNPEKWSIDPFIISGNYIKISNLEFRHSQKWIENTKSREYSIISYDRMINHRGNHLIFEGNKFHDAFEYFRANGNDLVVRNNELWLEYLGGVEEPGVTSCRSRSVWERNIIHLTTQARVSSHGMTFKGWGAREIDIFGNTFIANSNIATAAIMRLGAFLVPKATAEWEAIDMAIHDNLFYNWPGEIRIQHARDINIQNNIIYSPNLDWPSIRLFNTYFAIFDPEHFHNPKNIMIKNNIIVAGETNKYGNRDHGIMDVDNGSQEGFISDNNIWYSTKISAKINWLGELMDFADYVATSGQDIRSFAVEPKFVDADGADNILGTFDDNLHLQPISLAIDAGANSLYSQIDFDGNTRPQGAGVDIGAYEYQGAQTSLPGDIDGDGDVDIQDLLIVAKGYGVTYDLQDLLLVAMHYGEKI